MSHLHGSQQHEMQPTGSNKERLQRNTEACQASQILRPYLFLRQRKEGSKGDSEIGGAVTSAIGLSAEACRSGQSPHWFQRIRQNPQITVEVGLPSGTLSLWFLLPQRTTSWVRPPQRAGLGNVYLANVFTLLDPEGRNIPTVGSEGTVCIQGGLILSTVFYTVFLAKL